MEQIDSWAKQNFPICLNVSNKFLFVWNQVLKNLSMKPSNPHVVYSSLLLEHETCLGTENQNCEKEKKNSHWSQNIMGQMLQLVVRNMRGEIIYASLQKYKTIFRQTSLLLYMYTYSIHIAPSRLLDETLFSGRNRGFWAMCPLPS